jgi:hypothetical protein
VLRDGPDGAARAGDLSVPLGRVDVGPLAELVSVS